MSDCVQDLKLFGYSQTEAHFLRLVALHSGVFLTRQFNQFARAKTGYRVDAFIRKLKSNRHCHTYRLGKNAAMFHLHSKAIYRAIGHENLRHGRSHQAGYVKTKLLSLDFVLQNPTLRYFPTEEEKVELFTTVLNVPLSNLPSKRTRLPIQRRKRFDTSSINTRCFCPMFPRPALWFTSPTWTLDHTPRAQTS